MQTATTELVTFDNLSHQMHNQGKLLSNLTIEVNLFFEGQSNLCWNFAIGTMLHQSARKLINETTQDTVSKEIRYELMMMIAPVNHKVDGSVTKDQSREIHQILERVSTTR